MRDPETATLGFDANGALAGAASPIFLAGEIAANRFRVIRLLGQGGMAQVFEAEDLELGQNVAIKVIRPELATDSRARDLLRREVLLARRVTHANVCRIFDVFQHGANTLLLVMELVRGETLAQRLARGGPLTAAEALPIIRQLAEALDAAHRSQVVHGDFKSGNVILEPSPSGPRAVVTDFGLAQRSTALASGCAGGTTAYMAPEQLVGELTAASDVYALGVVIHEMVAGQRPHPARRNRARIDFMAALAPHGARPPALPSRWRTVVLSCLAPAPRERPASALAVARALEAGLPSRPLLGAGGVRRRLAVSAGAAALLVVCLGLVPPSGARQEGAPGAAAPVLAGALLGASPAAGDAEAPEAPLRLAIAIGEVQEMAPPPAGYAWVPAAVGHLILTELAAGGQVEAFQVPVVQTVQTAQTAQAAKTTQTAQTAQTLHAGPPGQAPQRVQAAAPDRLPAAPPSPAGAAAPGEPIPTARAAALGKPIPAAGTAAPSEPAPNAGPTPADLVTVTSCRWSGPPEDPAVEVDLRLERAASGEVLAALVEAGRVADLPALAARLGDRLRAALELRESTQGDRAAVVALRPATLAAEGLYAQGLERLLRGRDLEAFAALAQAIAADPGFPLSHVALARVCVELGYDRRAHAEALLAAQQASRMPEQQRLEINAISRRADGDRGGAEGLYQRLWQRAPHTADYGLMLAESQLDSDKSRETLETLRTIRQRGLDRGQEPLLDSLEARAHTQLGDAKQALATALGAQREARRAGNDFALAQALIDEAMALNLTGDGNPNKALAQAQDLYRRLAFRSGEARVLKCMGEVAKHAGATQQALSLNARALAIYEEVAAEKGASTVRVSTAMLLHQEGKHAEAARLLERALAGFRSIGDRQDEAIALNDDAQVEADLGHAQKAEQLYVDAETLNSELGNRTNLAAVLTDLATLELGNDNFNAARQHFEEALRIAEELGIKYGQAIGHINVGSVRAVEGNLRAARPHFYKALELARETNDRYLEAHAFSCLGTVFTDEGKFDLAESALRRALELESHDRNLIETPWLHLDLAHLDIRKARFAEAEREVRRSNQELQNFGTPPGGPALSYLVVAQVGQGKLEEARRTLAAAGKATSQAADHRLVLALAEARLALAEKRPADAARALADVVQRFSTAPHPDLLFEAQLYLGAAEIDAGRAAQACPELRALAAKTEAQGFEFVAHEAHRLLGGTAACKAAAPSAMGHG